MTLEDRGHDFSELWKGLEDLSSGALLFTDNARRVWDRSTYPDHGKMRASLEGMALAAEEWRAKEGVLGRSLSEWLREERGLTLAVSDEGLRRARKERFAFEDRNDWDRTPHIKLDEHTSPNAVGRIYFAIDGERWRWIVDHVGSKLY